MRRMAFGWILLAACFAQADSPSSRPAPAPRPRISVADVCHGPIDPFIPGRERIRFLAAAGTDNELTAGEFEAARAGGEPFPRTFDAWGRLDPFDKNESGTIDWFEAKAYREDLRRRVLVVYDADKDGRLTGRERDKANMALVAGDLRAILAVGATTRPAEDSSRRVDRRGRDRPRRDRRGGHGGRELLEREFIRLVKRYDKDGDGMLSDTELGEARRDARDEMLHRREEMRLRHFDENDDGELNEEEMQAVRAFEKRLAGVGDLMRKRMLDADGDGEVTDEERKTGMQQLAAVGMKMRKVFEDISDLDGDGEVTGVEQLVMRRRMQAGTQRMIETFVERADGDGDGRLNAPERDVVLRDFRDEFERRYAAHDADEDGRLTPDELVEFAGGFMREIMVPSGGRPEDADAREP